MRRLLPGDGAELANGLPEVLKTVPDREFVRSLRGNFEIFVKTVIATSIVFVAAARAHGLYVWTRRSPDEMNTFFRAVFLPWKSACALPLRTSVVSAWKLFEADVSRSMLVNTQWIPDVREACMGVDGRSAVLVRSWTRVPVPRSARPTVLRATPT